MSLKKAIKTVNAPPAVAAYSQAISAGGMLYVSGQLGMDCEGVMAADFEAQTKQSLDNLTAILEDAGCGLDDVVKTTVYLADIKDSPTFNGIYATYFPVEGNVPPPGRSCFAVKDLPKGGLVEVEAIALIP